MHLAQVCTSQIHISLLGGAVCPDVSMESSWNHWLDDSMVRYVMICLIYRYV